MRRIAKKAAVLAAIGMVVGCQSIETPWDRMRKQAASSRPAPAAEQEAPDVAEDRPKPDRKTSDPLMIPQQVRGGYADSPSAQ